MTKRFLIGLTFVAALMFAAQDATDGNGSGRLPGGRFGLTSRAPSGQKGPLCFLPSIFEEY
jgi:hypothetical protein